jgi:hypothetical protein
MNLEKQQLEKQKFVNKKKRRFFDNQINLICRIKKKNLIKQLNVIVQ